MALQGNINDLPMVDLLCFLTLHRKVGVLSVRWNGSNAQVCLNERGLWSAFAHHEPNRKQLHKAPRKVLHLQGEEALYDLLAWTQGDFAFELNEVMPTNQNLKVSYDYILLEYHRRQDDLFAYEVQPAIEEGEKLPVVMPALRPFYVSADYASA